MGSDCRPGKKFIEEIRSFLTLAGSRYCPLWSMDHHLEKMLLE